MLVLGIESSCDETAAAVVRDGRTVLSNVIASQHDLHEEYGGVVPEIASRAHVEKLIPVVRAALHDAGVTMGDIQAVAVGNQPGLIGALLVGVSAAKALAWSLGVPLVGVDHVRAHLYAGFLREANATAAANIDTHFPALGLVISGGHTAMFLCRSPLDVERLGSTIDDAIGEAYDKCAAMLEIAHPGGPKVDVMAQRGNDRAFDFPISRLSPESLDFSYSGLKTAVLYAIRGAPPAPPPRDKGSAAAAAPAKWQRDASSLTDQEKYDLCASFQRAAVRAVTLKLERAHESLKTQGIQPVSLLVGGGVSANSRLRAELQQLGEKLGLRVVLPGMAYCLDNAAMIAGLGHARLAAGQRDDLSLAASPSGAV